MQPIEHLTHIERITFVLAADLQDCDEDLIRLYALLALTKGTATTLADVHDAWALWRASSLPEHPAIVPFDDLDPSVQELDRPYMEAIHHAAKEGRSEAFWTGTWSEPSHTSAVAVDDALAAVAAWLRDEIEDLRTEHRRDRSRSDGGDVTYRGALVDQLALLQRMVRDIEPARSLDSEQTTEGVYG